MGTELENHKRLISLVHILCVPNVQMQCISLFLSTVCSMSDIFILYYYITGPATPPGTLPPPPDCCFIFSFLRCVLKMVLCPFVLFLLAIVLSVLRFTDFDYPFGIFKLFVPTCYDTRFDILFKCYIFVLRHTYPPCSDQL